MYIYLCSYTHETVGDGEVWKGEGGFLVAH